MPPDPRPPSRVRDPETLRTVHARERMRCALRDELHPDTSMLDGAMGYSLHHILKRPRDDVEANLIMLCGSGTTGCHGLVEHHDPRTMRALQRVVSERVDTWAHLCDRLGGPEPAADWIARLTRSRTGGSAA